MRHQQRIDFAVDDLFNRARREEHIRQNGAEYAEHNLAATFDRKLRHQRQTIVGVGGHHDNQRGIARQPQRIGVFYLDQRGEPDADARPYAAEQQHHHRRAHRGDHNGQRGDTADEGADNTQHAAIAQRAGVGIAAGDESGAARDDAGGHHRPARRFKVKMKADHQRRHQREGQLDRETQELDHIGPA